MREVSRTRVFDLNIQSDESEKEGWSRVTRGRRDSTKGVNSGPDVSEMWGAARQAH